MAGLRGLEIARLFYEEAIAPIIADVLPGARYTAGLLGPCSDVIGFDDATSRDHGWGPRGHVLLEPAGFDDARAALDAALRQRLPCSFRGYSTSFEGHDARPVAVDAPPIAHWVDIHTPKSFLRAQIGVGDTARLTPVDWLAVHEHRLRSVTAGALFRDDLGFEVVRRQLAHYPDDVRLHLIAAEWRKIAQEQAFPARAGSRGDEIGSALVCARLAESLMRLCFYIERVYPPYSKWFGSGFARLACSGELRAPITAMLAATDWQARDAHWSVALRAVIVLHERAGLVAPGKYQLAPVYVGRPGTGLPGFERGGPPSIEQLIADLRGKIMDPAVHALPAALGSINQLSACCDLNDELALQPAIAALYQRT